MIKISELKKAGKEELKDLQALMDQLSGDPKKYPPLKLKDLTEMVTDKKTALFVAKDGALIVGTATLNIMSNLRGCTGYIDNVIVHEGYRGQGLGKKLSQEIIALAKKKGLRRIDLTTRPARNAANALYQKLGFELRETNPYELKLK